MIRKSSNLGLHSRNLKPISGPVILQRENPTADVREDVNVAETSQSKIHERTCNERAKIVNSMNITKPVQKV